MGCWMYELRLYESRSIAQYIAMSVRDDQLLSGEQEPRVHIFRTKKGKFGVKYQVGEV